MRVHLTFDAEHPGQRRHREGNANAVANILFHRDVPATFFLQGRWVTAYPELARRIAGEHAVGSHGHWHVPYSLLSEQGRRVDADEAAWAITGTTGVEPRLFRFPNSSPDPHAAEGREDVEALGYRVIGWDVFAADWTPERTAESVLTSVIEGVAQVGDGAVILLHTWPDPTVEALPDIIDRLRQAGADLQPIG